MECSQGRDGVLLKLLVLRKREIVMEWKPLVLHELDKRGEAIYMNICEHRSLIQFLNLKVNDTIVVFFS